MTASIWNEQTLPEPPLPEPDEQSYRTARDRLIRAFERVRVDCSWVDGPIGRVFLAGGPRGLCRVALGHREATFLDELERDKLLPRLSPESLGAARRELEEYFAGRRQQFALALDLGGVTAFQRQVLDSAMEIPFGEVKSYGAIARHLHKPGASRAVGNALGRNPLPIVVPCHRVVASGGGIGGYTGGVDIKRTLMQIEGIEPGSG